MSDQQRLTPTSGRVRRARRLTDASGRRRAGEFLVEGPQAVREALARPDTVREVWATADASARHPELRASAERTGVVWTDVDLDVVEALSDTVTPQGMVARCALVTVDAAAAVVPGARLVAVPCDVRDPGNAGTIVRCADAAGANAVVLAGHSVDPHNPKAVRASVGSLFHLPVATEADVAAAVESVRAAGLTVLAADGADSPGTLDLLDPATDDVLMQPAAWLFGNEAHGLPAEVRDLADHVVAVPVYGRAESLNLATAAAVCLYASARAQRR